MNVLAVQSLSCSLVNVFVPPLSMAELHEYNHVQLLKITPFIHWEMGFSRLANTIWKGRRLFSVLGHCGSPPKTTCIYCGDLSCDTHLHFTGIFLLHKLIFWLPFFHILFLHVHECLIYKIWWIIFFFTFCFST